MKVENEIKAIRNSHSNTIDGYRGAYKTFTELRDRGLTKQKEKDNCFALSNIKKSV